MSNSREESVDSSTTVLSNFCKGNTKNKSKRSTGASPLAGSNKDEHDHQGQEFVCALRAKVKNGLDDHKREMASDARRYIGIIVTKIFSGERYIGKVEHYDIETGLYKIVYDDGDSEDVNKTELLELIPPPELVRTYLKQREARKKEIERKRPAIAKASNSPNICLPRKKAEPKTKRARCNKTPSTYVPLAIKETKKDAYYWY